MSCWRRTTNTIQSRHISKSIEHCRPSHHHCMQLDMAPGNSFTSVIETARARADACSLMKGHRKAGDNKDLYATLITFRALLDLAVPSTGAKFPAIQCTLLVQSVPGLWGRARWKQTTWGTKSPPNRLNPLSLLGGDFVLDVCPFVLECVSLPQLPTDK